MQKSLHAMLVIVVLLLGGYSAGAQDKTFSDWIFGQRGTVVFAKTSIDSNTEFVRSCSDNTCAWILLANVSCTQGTYSVFINSSAGNALTTMACGQTTTPSYQFTDSDLINRLINQANQISVAIPLADGQIKVILFSLRGAPEALGQLQGRGGSGSIPPPPQCNQLVAAFWSCKSQAEEALKKCAVWHGPGPCRDLGPVCILPSRYNSRCSP